MRLDYAYMFGVVTACMRQEGLTIITLLTAQVIHRGCGD